MKGGWVYIMADRYRGTMYIGVTSDIAARVAADLDVEVPFDPGQEATDRADAAFPLAEWTADAGPAGEADHGHAQWSPSGRPLIRMPAWVL